MANVENTQNAKMETAVPVNQTPFHYSMVPVPLFGGTGRVPTEGQIWPRGNKATG